MAIVTFETLREVQRREKKSENLSPLTDEFYAGINEYFEREKKNDLLEARNARNVFEDIKDRREKKILNLALKSARLNEKIDTNAMATKERALFATLASALGAYRKVGVEEKREQAKTKEIEEITKSEAKNIAPSAIEEKNSNYLKIKVLEDMPQIVGADLKDYGPFKRGETAELPKENAQILINKKIAEVA